MTQLYLTMPQPGETITEGTVVEWLIKKGDELQENSPVAQLETEKAVFEYESPFEGKIVELLCNDGDRIKVAHPIAIIDVDADKAKIYQMMGIAKLVNQEAHNNQTIKTSTQNQSTEVDKNSKSTVLANTETSSSLSFDQIKISPYCRKLARENNLSTQDLLSLASENPDTRVTVDALKNYKRDSSKPATPKATSIKPQTHSDNVRIVPCSPIRQRIAENMVISKSKIPHAHNGIAVDLTHVVAFRDKHKEAFKKKYNTNLNLLSLIYPALVKAIQIVPVINASYDDTSAKHVIKIFENINLGVAAGTENGLVIPVVSNIGSLSFVDFNKNLNDKLDKASRQKLMPQDISGATLIFNNFGFFGTQIGVQVIQYPMAATLGMSTIEQRVVPYKEGIAIRTMCDFILSFDHRVMDGRETGIFLAELKKGIENLDFSHIPL